MKIIWFSSMVLCFVLLTTIHSEAQTSDIDLYKVGVNDVLEIVVLDHPDLRTASSVSADGTITFPYLGNVYVKDMNLSDIKENIQKRLSDSYIKYPVVSVSLVKSMSKKVYSFGEVLRRGAISYEKNMTLMMALSMMGGTTNNGLFGELKVKRKSGQGKYKVIVDIELDNGFINDKKIEDMLLESDDIIIVERSKTMLIQGEVVSRGRVTLEKNMTVVRALLQSGGVAKDGLNGKLIIRRKNAGLKGKYKVVAETKLYEGRIKNSEIENMILLPDDIMVVERSKTYLIEGQVLNSGRYVIEKDMTVLRALLQARGVAKDGLHGKLKIRRKKEEEVGNYVMIAESDLHDGVIINKATEDLPINPDDILFIERNKTFLIQGSVNNLGRFALEKDMTVLRALLQAGGVTNDGLYGKLKVRRLQDKSGNYIDFVESRLDNGVMLSKEVEDTKLYPDDILVVERSKTFFIYGEVKKIGEFMLKHDMTVLKAITLAGGFTKWGSADRVKVLRKELDKQGFKTIKVDLNDVIAGDQTADITLQADDVVIASPGIL